MYVIVALGNPGKKYEKTRHNVAWMLVDEIFGADGWETSSQGQALFREIDDVVVIKPATFMNRSGEAVRFFVKKYELNSNQVIVVHDDIDLLIGTFKISQNRGSGGHNGVQSIDNHLGTKDFIRIRVGISGKRLFSDKLAKPNVLGQFSSAHIKKIDHIAPLVEKAIRAIVTDGAESAMNQFN